jgi:YD repeat-containing protein
MQLSNLPERNNRNALRRTAAILTALIVISLAQRMSAQDYLQAVGAPVFTSAEPVELGFVNASNGNLHLEIPVASFPQRGLPPLSYKFVYDSRIWVQSGGSAWVPNATSTSWLGWRFVTSADMGTINNNSTVKTCSTGGDTIQNGFYWQAPDGTIHTFGVSLQFTNNCGGTVQLCSAAPAQDNSGYYMVVNTSQSCVGQTGHTQNMGYTVIGPDGTQVSANAAGANFEDANGNYYTRDSNNNVIDTLGRTPVVVTTTSCGTNKTCYNVQNSQGATTSQWVVTTEPISVNTDFPVWGNYTGTLTAIQSITLPDGTAYDFTYNAGTSSGHYGELTGITLPNGGQISYGYSLYEDALQHYNRWVTQHTSGGGTTAYTLGNVNTTNATQSVTVTKQSGDNKVYTFQVGNGTSSYGAWHSSVSFNSAAGTLLGTVNDVYTGYDLGQLLSSETVTLQTPAGSVSKQKTFAYADAINMAHPTSIKEWNYYSGSPATNPDRITNITYQDQLNSAYGSPEWSASGRNILTLPAEIQVMDGNSNLLSQTNYAYDTTTVGSISNIAQHDDTNYGTSMTVRGNRTQVSQLTGGTSYLTAATINYDMTGQMTSSKDANSNTTSYSHTDCFLSGNPPTTYTPTKATNAYVTTLTLPVSGAQTGCYYYNTGKTGWTQDQNSAKTSYFFVTSSGNDPLDRLITETLPGQGWVLNNFSTPPTTVDSYTGIQGASPSASCTACRHDQAKLDGLTRPTDQFLVNDPDGQTDVHTDYDTNGRVLDTSHPYRSTGDPTYGLDTYSYDGMDRVTEVAHQDGTALKTYYGAAISGAGGKSTQLCPTGTCHLGYPTLTADESGKLRQIWTDGLGNIVEVDEPTASAAAGTWGSSPTVTYYLYDLLGDLTQATVVGSQELNRVYTYDALSRMTQSTEPEPGTTSYYYVTSSGAMCSGNPSSICRRTDARGTTTTYTYDAANRSTGMTYSDTTPAVTYFYDQTSFNGLTIANGLGRLTGMTDGSGKTAWSYDSHGNISTERRTIAGVTNSVFYTHNEDNSLASITYPSGRVVSYSIGQAQRPIAVIDGDGVHYVGAPASGAMYAPNGALASAVYGRPAHSVESLRREVTTTVSN